MRASYATDELLSDLRRQLASAASLADAPLRASAYGIIALRATLQRWAWPYPTDEQTAALQAIGHEAAAARDACFALRTEVPP